jgi:hypothetical protein
LGKTHLLEGIGAALRARQPGLRLLHLTAEGFTNGFLDAMRTGSLPSFRARYRKADALIVDDVHFLAAKRATQDEFLHTYNALVAEGAAIVLACDQHPRLIAKLTDELATRFLAGMVVKLEAPDLATRRAILKAKAAARGVDVPEAVIGYVAEHLRSSVRELEGALHSLIAHAVLAGKRLDLTLAKAALRDTIRHTAQAVALKDVERAVCELFGIDAETLKSEGRSRAVSHPGCWPCTWPASTPAPPTARSAGSSAAATTRRSSPPRRRSPPGSATRAATACWPASRRSPTSSRPWSARSRPDRSGITFGMIRSHRSEVRGQSTEPGSLPSDPHPPA